VCELIAGLTTIIAALVVGVGAFLGFSFHNRYLLATRKPLPVLTWEKVEQVLLDGED